MRPPTPSPILSRVTLGYASKDNSTSLPPEGAPDGLYYTVTIAKSAGDLGSRVFVDANTGKVFKK